MGGRGSSSGISAAGKPYGSEYKTIYQVGNIKYIKKTSDDSEAPFETKTKGRVYVLLNKQNEPKSIIYYDNELKRSKTVDFSHYHKKMNPHAHHGYKHSENDGPKGATNATPEEKKMVDYVKRMWQNRKSK